MDDRRKVRVVERDRLEPAVPVLEHVEQARDLVARGRLADQVAQVPLTGDEADDRRGPGTGGRLGELGDLLHLLVDLVGVGDEARQPQHQFVEEQDDRVAAEHVLCVLADDRQPLVEVDVGGLVGADGARVALERAHEEVADQPPTLRAVLRFGEGPVQAGRVPAGGAPLLCLGVGRRKEGDELVVTHLLTELDGVRDQAVVTVDGRKRDARVLLGDVGHVAAEDSRVEGLRVGEMVRHEQERAACEPAVVLGHDIGEALLAAGVGVALEDRVEHRHEVRLAGAEGAVEVGGPRRAGLEGGLDQV